jgi:hypothetical protein
VDDAPRYTFRSVFAPTLKIDPNSIRSIYPSTAAANHSLSVLGGTTFADPTHRIPDTEGRGVN